MIDMRNRNKKLILILSSIIVVLLIITAVVALIFGTGNNRDPNTKPNDRDIELIYWGLWEPIEVMQPIIDEYEDMNPGVKILYSQQTFKNYDSRLYTRLEQAAASSEPAPDIFRINNTWLPKFQKFLSDVPDRVMTRQEYSEEFYPTALDDFTGSDGKIYAIPWEIDGLAVFYNKQLLAEAGYSEPPSDWDSFMDAADKLTKKDGTGRITKSGLAIGTSRNITHSADIFGFLLLQNNASIMNSSRTQVNLTSERSVTALTTYTSFATGSNPVWAPYLPNDLTMFFRGDLAMMFGPSWRAFDIIESAPQIEFGIATLPQLPTNDPVYYSMYWGEGVRKTSPNQLEAWKFIKYLSEPEQQVKLFRNSSQIRAFGEPYSRVSLNKELLANPYTKAFGEMAPHMKSWQMGEQFFVEDLLRNAITEVVENKREPATVLSNLEKDINNQLAVSNR
jgi:multiple sugar transport system substrate-binding protein